MGPGQRPGPILYLMRVGVGKCRRASSDTATVSSSTSRYSTGHSGKQLGPSSMPMPSHMLSPGPALRAPSGRLV